MCSTHCVLTWLHTYTTDKYNRNNSGQSTTVFTLNRIVHIFLHLIIQQLNYLPNVGDFSKTLK